VIAAIHRHQRRGAHVSQADAQAVVQQHIVGLDVAVDNGRLRAVQVLQRQRHLIGDADAGLSRA
jgi:hypothetical protein